MNGLDANVDMDENNSVKADAKLWRLVVKDRQLIPEGSDFKSLLAPDYQAIIGNPQIEEACAAAEGVADTEEKLKIIRLRLGERKLSQLHVMVDMKKGESNNVDVQLADFRIVLAAPTVMAIARILRHVNAVKAKVMPQIAAVSAKKEEPKQTPHPHPLPPATSERKKVPVEAEGIDSTKLVFRGRLKNISLLLPETVYHG